MSALTHTTVTTALAQYQKSLNDNLTILYNGNTVLLNNSLSDETISALTILSLEGKKIITLSCSAEKMQTLETGSLSRGVYILEAEVGKNVLHKKFIVQ